MIPKEASYLRIGITGPTGSGKGEVSRILRGKGYPVIDADQVARQVTNHDPEALLDLVKAFGEEILFSDGSLNRRKLGDIAFSSSEKTKQLNDTIFPHIRKAVAQAYAKEGKGHSIVFLDAPTLLESGISSDYIISVLARPSLRKSRLLAREPDLTPEQIDTRISAQPPDDFYKKASDFTIYNESDLETLTQQVEEVLFSLLDNISEMR